MNLQQDTGPWIHSLCSLTEALTIILVAICE